MGDVEASGQAVNVNKSNVLFGAKVSRGNMKNILCSMEMKGLKGPIKYLAVLVDGKRIPISAFKPNVDKI